PGEEWGGGASATKPPMTCRKPIRRCRNRGVPLPPGSVRENPEACPSGIRHVGGAKLNQALVRNVRTCRSDAKGDVQAAHTARTRVPKRSTGAEESGQERPNRRPACYGRSQGGVAGTLTKIRARQACYRPITADGLPLIGRVPGSLELTSQPGTVSGVFSTRRRRARRWPN